jgi:hypothetical protein
MEQQLEHRVAQHLNPLLHVCGETGMEVGVASNPEITPPHVGALGAEPHAVHAL